MRVIAAKADGSYFLSRNDDLEGAMSDDNARGRFLRTAGHVVLMPAVPMHSFLSAGRWEKCHMTREETDALLVRLGLPPVNQTGVELPDTRVYPAPIPAPAITTA